MSNERYDDDPITIRQIVDSLNSVLTLPQHTVVGASPDDKQGITVESQARVTVVAQDYMNNREEAADDATSVMERMHRLYFSAPGNVNSEPFLSVQHTTLKIPKDEPILGFTSFHRSHGGLQRALKIYKDVWEGKARRAWQTSIYKTQSQEYLGLVSQNLHNLYPPMTGSLLNPANGGMKLSASKPNALILSITLNQIRESEIAYIMDAIHPFLTLPTTHEAKE